MPCMGLGSQFVVLDKPQKGWHMFASQNAGLKQSGKYFRPEYAPWPAEQHSCTHHLSWSIWSILYRTDEYAASQILERVWAWSGNQIDLNIESTKQQIRKHEIKEKTWQIGRAHV